MVRTEEGSVLYLYTKFEALFIQKLFGEQNSEVGSRDLGHANLGSFCGPYAEGVRPPSLYQISSG